MSSSNGDLGHGASLIALFLLTCISEGWRPHITYSEELAQPQKQPPCVRESARIDKDRRDRFPELKLSVDAHAWALAITSGGGFFGGGAGNLSVDSQGSLKRWGPLLNGGSGKAQTGAAERLTAALATARPAAWRACYVRPENPSGCCDMFRYILTLRLRADDGKEEEYQLSWFSDSGERLPPDARTIVDAAQKLVDNVLGPKNKPPGGAFR